MVPTKYNIILAILIFAIIRCKEEKQDPYKDIRVDCESVNPESIDDCRDKKSEEGICCHVNMKDGSETPPFCAFIPEFYLRSDSNADFQEYYKADIVCGSHLLKLSVTMLILVFALMI